MKIILLYVVVALTTLLVSINFLGCNVINRHRDVSKTKSDSATNKSYDSSHNKTFDSSSRVNKENSFNKEVKQLENQGINLKFDTSKGHTTINIGGVILETEQNLQSASFNNHSEKSGETTSSNKESSSSNFHKVDSGTVKKNEAAKVVTQAKAIGTGSKGVKASPVFIICGLLFLVLLVIYLVKQKTSPTSLLQDFFNNKNDKV